MARPRAFSVDGALDRAVAIFRRRGYAGASMEGLTAAMAIGRGSLYAAFGDKRALFLAALARYAAATSSGVASRLDGAADPLAGIHDVLRMVARRAAAPDGRSGCLITNTLAELGPGDGDVDAITRAALDTIEGAYERALCRAQAAGALSHGRSPKRLARFLVMTMQGLRIMGCSGASARELLAMADTAIEVLGREGEAR